MSVIVANGSNGSRISKETLLPLSLILVFLGSAFWFGVEKTRLEGEVAECHEEIEDLKQAFKDLETEVDAHENDQIRWDARLKEASVNAQSNESRIERLEKSK